MVLICCTLSPYICYSIPPNHVKQVVKLPVIFSCSLWQPFVAGVLTKDLSDELDESSADLGVGHTSYGSIESGDGPSAPLTASNSQIWSGSISNCDGNSGDTIEFRGSAWARTAPHDKTYSIHVITARHPTRRSFLLSVAMDVVLYVSISWELGVSPFIFPDFQSSVNTILQEGVTLVQKEQNSSWTTSSETAFARSWSILGSKDCL